MIYQNPAGVYTQARVTLGELQRIALQHLTQAVNFIHIKRTLQSGLDDREYRQDTGYELDVVRSLSELQGRLLQKVQQLVDAYPEYAPLKEALQSTAPQILRSTNLSRIWDVYRGALLETYQHLQYHVRNSYDESCRVSVQDRYLLLDLASDGVPESTPVRARFVLAVSQMLEHLRDDLSEPSLNQLFATHVAYHYLSQGTPVLKEAKAWGNPGFRDVQTYMSVTDPGLGHLHGTTTDNAFLHGVIVHIEHLERGVSISREVIEPYRIPAPHIIPQVRMHVGDRALTSSYVGRPMFEDTVENGMIKTVHTFGAAISALFMDGLTECKLAMERMTATETIDFMQTMAGNVRRDRFTQTLSAAFNLNTPILDDRPETIKAKGEAVWVSTPYEVGRLGIELTVAGGFDKVTWDGTADTYPSKCIIEQITFQEALMLVHKAHEQGLLTYFSAGFRFHHLPQVVHTGVDGVGIGGAQILRYMDPTNGNQGAFKQDNITEILRIRDEAARTLKGRAAHLLCRLDQMFFEKSLTPAENAYRGPLVRALVADDETAMERILHDLQHILVLPEDTRHPMLAQAARLLRSDSRSLLAQSFSPEQWREAMQELQQAFRQEDASRTHHLLSSLRSRARS